MGAIGRGRVKPAVVFMRALGARLKYLNAAFDTPLNRPIEAGLEMREVDLSGAPPIAPVEPLIFIEVEGPAKFFAVLLGHHQVQALGESLAEVLEKLAVQILAAPF